MRSVVHASFGDPAAVLTLQDRPMPSPGPGEIRVRLVMSPIHNHDLWTIRGSYGYKPALPAVGGTEALGVVDAQGEGVTAPAIGQRVVISGVNGVWAEYFLAPAARAIPLPGSVDDETGCQLIAMPLSSLMLLEDLELSPGQWLIQNAANGAVGRLVATFAKARGIHAVHVVRRDAGVEELARLGIEHAVSTESPGWEDRIRAMVDGAPILRGIESVGGAAANQLLSVMAPGSTLFAFGSMSGKPLEIDSSHLIFRAVTVKGFWGATRAAEIPRAEIGRMIGELVQMAASGALRLPVDSVFDLADAGAAAAASDKPGRGGKVVLKA